MRAGDLLFQHPHDAAAIEGAGQFVELRKLLDAPIGFLQLQPALIERLPHRAGKDPEKHAAPDRQHEHQHGGKAFEMIGMRHSERLVGQKKQRSHAYGHHRPHDRRLCRRRAQRAEIDDEKQRAEKHHAHFGREIGEGKHDCRADEELRHDEIMVLEALGKSGFRQRQVKHDRDETRRHISRTDVQRHGAGLGIEQQDHAIEQIARRDHSLNLPPLPRPARSHFCRQLETNAIQLSRNRIQKRRRSAAHRLAIGETGSKI